MTIEEHNIVSALQKLERALNEVEDAELKFWFQTFAKATLKRIVDRANEERRSDLLRELKDIMDK